MNIHKAKMNADLLNLALSPIKQLKIQNKIQLIYIYTNTNLYTNEYYYSLDLGTTYNCIN